MLIKLEKLGILEQHPNRHVRLLISRNIFWQTNGPLWQTYHQLFVEDFMDSSFGLPNERLIFSPGQFSEASEQLLQISVELQEMTGRFKA